MIKALQTIPLDVHLFGKEETNERKDQKAQKKIRFGPIKASTEGRKKVLTIEPF